MKQVPMHKYLYLTAFLVLLYSCAGIRDKSIVILETTDVHGVILPYDFVEKQELKASLASACSYISETRRENKNVILLDDGDNLQGQPAVYYYNFIDTSASHINADAMNFMGYDACTAGNHDIEAGHPVYDRLVKEYKFPVLAANAVDKNTGQPYFDPYVVIRRNGLRIAVFGLITPAVPDWLPPELYSGIEFRDMVETARQWMPVIRKEKPDLIVGLFHSGWDERELDAGNESGYENGSAAVAREVPGFDIILIGHDHNVMNTKIANSEGDTVLVLDGGSRSEKIARADIVFTRGKKIKSFKGQIIDVKDFKSDPLFVSAFSEKHERISTYVDKVIATSLKDVSSRDSYFGPSAFIDMIHEIQLEITGADVSFAAPLSFDVKISAGPVTVGDMFKLYRFENMLYTYLMTGEEIRKYLEYSYSGWVNTMDSPDDVLLKFRVDKNGKTAMIKGRAWLSEQPYNFDSGAGINYLVDVRKPEGERVVINSLSKGDPFDLNKTYKVAVNSYRGNGGGGHLTTGAGISKSELTARLVTSTNKDFRYFILKYLESKKTIDPKPANNWKIVPEDWVENARLKESVLLFGE